MRLRAPREIELLEVIRVIRGDGIGVQHEVLAARQEGAHRSARGRASGPNVTTPGSVAAVAGVEREHQIGMQRHQGGRIRRSPSRRRTGRRRRTREQMPLATLRRQRPGRSFRSEFPEGRRTGKTALRDQPAPAQRRASQPPSSRPRRRLCARSVADGSTTSAGAPWAPAESKLLRSPESRPGTGPEPYALTVGQVLSIQV